jgi:diamine N-acetyltransferase
VTESPGEVGGGVTPVTPRSVAEGAVVELREVTGETVRAICRLEVAADQVAFVAPNAVSFAEAYFEPKAWFRAIYADDEPVGFAMLSLDPEKPEYYLWRLMIAAGAQGRGYGRAAVHLLVDHVRTLPGATELLVSWVPADGGPEPFYRGLGFIPTGEIHDGEVVARLAL